MIRFVRLFIGKCFNDFIDCHMTCKTIEWIYTYSEHLIRWSSRPLYNEVYSLRSNGSKLK